MSKFFFILFFFTSVLKGEGNYLLPPFLSLALPGGGQFYNEKYIKGAVFATTEVFLIYSALLQADRRRDVNRKLANLTVENPNYLSLRNRYKSERDFYRRDRDKYIWLSIACVLVSMGDAFVDDHFKEYDESIFKNLEINTSFNRLEFCFKF